MRIMAPLLLLLLLLHAGASIAATRDAAPQPLPDGPAAYAGNANMVTGFAGPDQWIIPRYFERLREDQIRAKASRKKMARELPPGVAKRPAKGDILPGNFERRPLPTALTRDLPRLPSGIDRLIFAQDIALVRSDGLVLDVIADVVK